MSSAIVDPMAGVTARAMIKDPAAPRRNSDPTDPGYGKLGSRELAGEARRIWDTTDPACGKPIAAAGAR